MAAVGPRRLILALALATTARAGPVEDAAGAVLAARDDAEVLARLAARRRPDPWLVADELSARGENVVARAFARAAPQAIAKSLPAYVRARTAPAPGRAIHEQVSAALAGEDWAGALAAASRYEGELDTVPAIRIRFATGQALENLGRRAESARAYREAGDAALSLGWVMRAGRSFHHCGLVASAHADWRVAVDAWRESLKLARHLGEQPTVAITLNRIGIALTSLGEYDAAARELERALAIARDVGDKHVVASALSNLGTVHRKRGRPAPALQAYERAVAMAEEVGDKQATAEILLNIGAVHLDMGANDRALDAYRRSLGIAKRLGDRLLLAKLQGNLASVHEDQGRYEEALAAQRRALEAFESLGDRSASVRATRAVARIHAARGEYEQALAEARRAVRVAESLNEPENIAGALTELGSALERLGRFEEAFVAIDRALEVATATGSRSATASALVSLGNVHRRLGELTDALEAFRRARKTYESANDPGGIASTTNNIGLIHERRGEYAQALAAYRRSIETARALGDRPGVAISLNNLAIVHRRVGDYARALDACRRSIAIKKDIGDRHGVARTLNLTGTVHQRRGEYDRAIAAFQRSRTLAKDIGDPILMAHCSHNVATVHEKAGDHERALVAYRSALEEKRRIGRGADIASTLGGIGTAQRMSGSFRAALASYSSALEELAAEPDPASRARVLFGMANAHFGLGELPSAIAYARRAATLVVRLGSGLGDEQGAAAGQLWVSVFELGALASARADDVEGVASFLEMGRAVGLRETLAAGRALREALIPRPLLREEAAIRQREIRATEELARVARTGRRNPEVKRALDRVRRDREEIVSRIQRVAKAGAAIAYPQDEDLRTIQSRLAPSEALVLYGLTSAEGLALVVRRSSARVVRLTRSDMLVGTAHPRKQLVEPLQLDESVRRILISPAGRLAYVPFAQLLPDREVVYVPSGTTYGLLRAEHTERGRGVLAIGDPRYERLAPLPATRREVERIGDVRLLGADATVERVTAALKQRPRWRAIHFACHGRVDPGRPLLSSLALTGGSLACLDVFRLKVPADLVVLSACDTAKGKVYATEGIVGLTRAFMYAGAPRVICSLWKVDDNATQALMVKFYELWKDRPAATALKQAQAYVAGHEKWKDPRYWAAWQLWGLPD